MNSKKFLILSVFFYSIGASAQSPSIKSGIYDETKDEICSVNVVADQIDGSLLLVSVPSLHKACENTGAVITLRPVSKTEYEKTGTPSEIDDALVSACPEKTASTCHYKISPEASAFIFDQSTGKLNVQLGDRVIPVISLGIVNPRAFHTRIQLRLVRLNHVMREIEVRNYLFLSRYDI